MNKLHHLANALLDAKESLWIFFNEKKIDKEYIINNFSEKDVGWIVKMLKEKEFHFHFFRILLIIDKDTALEFIREFYLKDEVQLLNYPSNHINDLYIFFDDINELYGSKVLREVINQSAGKRNTKYSQVLDALSFALNIDKNEVEEWKRGSD